MVCITRWFSTFKWSIRQLPDKHCSTAPFLRTSPLCSNDSPLNGCRKKAVDILNPGQVPIITVDQPLFTIAKQIQWNWTESHGEDQFVIMFGGLHIEIAAFKTIGNLLESSGWTGALVQANVASPGTADSFLRAAHATRTRRAH